jgi:hypothetical protein
MPELDGWRPPRESPWTPEAVAILLKVAGPLLMALLIIVFSFVLIIQSRDWKGWVTIVLPVISFFVGQQVGSTKKTYGSR